MIRKCSNCSITTMEPHPELYYWFKCQICGYSEFNLEWLHPDVRENASKHKFAKQPDLMIKDLWKNKTIYI